MDKVKKKKLFLVWRANGNIEICCPYCKKVIFSGYCEGFTFYSLDGKCPYCEKEVDEKWEEKR